MPVPTILTDLSATAASNSPAGTDNIGTTADDYLRGIQAALRAGLAHKGADIASTTTPDLGAVAGLFHDITGTTEIQGFGTVSAGIWKVLQFDGALQLTHNATSLILPGGANITTAAGDMLMTTSEGSGNWRVNWYVPAAYRLTTSDFAYANTVGSSGRLLFPRNWISGLVMSLAADTEHDITIASGECRDGSNAQNMLLASAITKRIDASWAVGTGQGGLDGTESSVGTPDVSTWYYIWLIKRSDTGVVDALYSESASSPTMPTDYDYKRLIGAVLTDASANIVGFVAFEDSGGGVKVRWTALVADHSAAMSATSALIDVRVPILPVEARINANHSEANSTAHRVYISSPHVTDQAVDSTNGIVTISGEDGGNTQGQDTAQHLPIYTTTGQVRLVADQAGGNVVIATAGWDWSRR